MIAVGSSAPDFTLDDQFGRPFHLADFRGKRNVLLAFVPLAHTPTCSRETPELDAMAPRFLHEANTVVAVVDVDSRHTNAAWGQEMGGIRIPILSDFEPKGAVGKAYGLYIPGRGVDDRATVLIDTHGIVRFAASAGVDTTVDHRRRTGDLLALARRLGSPAPAGAPVREPASPPPGYALYVTASCGYCKRVIRTAINLRCPFPTHYVDYDAAGRAALMATGNDAVPALLGPGVDLRGADAVERALVELCPAPR